jgi:putative transposase
MKFRMIAEERSYHSVSRLARVLGVTAAGYHAWKKRKPCARQLKDERLKERIGYHFQASHGTYGAPRLLDDLPDGGIRISCKRVARLMRELGIAGISGREGKPRRRKSGVLEGELAADLARREFRADEPNQVWFADITYVPT